MQFQIVNIFFPNFKNFLFQTVEIWNSEISNFRLLCQICPISLELCDTNQEPQNFALNIFKHF